MTRMMVMEELIRDELEEVLKETHDKRIIKYRLIDACHEYGFYNDTLSWFIDTLIEKLELEE